MKQDLVICEHCGKSFLTLNEREICNDCSISTFENKMSENEKNILKQKRKLAKNFGAKALKGSIKQKKWAEQIREKYIKECRFEEKLKDYIHSDLLDSKFWINNRNNENTENDLIELIRLTREINSGNKEYLVKRNLVMKNLSL